MHAPFIFVPLVLVASVFATETVNTFKIPTWGLWSKSCLGKAWGESIHHVTQVRSKA